MLNVDLDLIIKFITKSSKKKKKKRRKEDE